MEIIPAIDLLNGNCVRLHKGNYAKVTEFNKDPVAQALIWQNKGAKRLHLVDLDGAKSGEPINDESIRSIREALDIPIQIGGGIRSVSRAESLLELGLDQVIVGTIAVEAPEIVKNLARKYPGKIILGIDAKDGCVATKGWINQSHITSTNLAESYSDDPIAAIISTDIETDGTLAGPNIDSLKEIAKVSNFPVIASGGVGCITDLISLLALEPYGINAVIVGRALYDGSFELEEAIRVLKHGIIHDPIQSDTYTV